MTEQNPQTAIFKDEETQKNLNTPLKHGGTSENKDFLEMLVKLVNEGKIDLYKPSCLINHEVYDKLDQASKAKADYESVTLLASIREIKGLYDAGHAETYQIDNLVEGLRLAKERLETEGGDLFII